MRTRCVEEFSHTEKYAFMHANHVPKHLSSRETNIHTHISHSPRVLSPPSCGDLTFPFISPPTLPKEGNAFAQASLQCRPQIACSTMDVEIIRLWAVLDGHDSVVFTPKYRLSVVDVKPTPEQVSQLTLIDPLHIILIVNVLSHASLLCTCV